MFSFLKKIVSFLFSPKAVKAVETADKVLGQVDKAVDAVREFQKKGK